MSGELSGVAEVVDHLTRGTLSCVEVTTHFLQRIDAHNAHLNALVDVDTERALASAQQADQLRAKGSAPPLAGVPIVHKALFCVKDRPTTCASRMLETFSSPFDATVVAKLERAGMVMLGTANMDEFAMGSSNENSVHGPARNPWDTARVTGGSSGGSAAAVAAGLAPVATGTDTGGSIRQPAALCGVTGIKPTYGRVSRFGMIAFASSLDQAGVLATSARDAAVVLQTMCGADPADATSVDRAVPDFASELNGSVKGLRIGVVEDYFDDRLDPEIAASVRTALDALVEAGARLVPVSLPSVAAAVPAYYVVSSAECSSNLSRFDGVRYGRRCENPADLDDLYTRSRAEGFGAEVQRRILAGTYVLSAGYYDAYYLKAQRVRRRIANELADVLRDVDVLAGPTAPETAFAVGEKADDPVAMYLSDIYTVSASLAGLPAISAPCRPSRGLPVGVQFVGRPFDESTLLRTVHALQCVTDWHQQRPAGF
ncbi:MAG: Asp-tRNA(Asn)/Glu-tRNA(Gln) amidotransferase subunit GatA [Pseudomonadota bacterium]